MSWVLIFWITVSVGGDSAGITSGQVQFESKTSCEIAASSMLVDTVTRGKYGENLHAICVFTK